MRKRIIGSETGTSLTAEPDWLKLDELAQVEITSEDAAHTIETALLSGRGTGWLAGSPGEQTVRLVFDSRQTIRRIFLEFPGNGGERTQEFVLRWSGDDGRSFDEIVRQQWNFGVEDKNGETEDYHVDLPSVSVLELIINPDISHSDVRASLSKMRLA